MRLDLANGWTLSVVNDLHAPFYSVVAWPTADEPAIFAANRRWLVFGHGGTEQRICTLEDFVEVADFVASSASPNGTAGPVTDWSAA